MTHAVAPTAPLTTLDTLKVGAFATVVHVAPGDDSGNAGNDGANLARRLMELGFVPGEKIRMLKRGMPGGEPLAIKVGNSTFALRRFEAALISIQAE
jgi:ferrous iron transport protein A